MKEGHVAALALPAATPPQGGVPIFTMAPCSGQSTSVATTPQQDEDIAKAGAARASSRLNSRLVGSARCSQSRNGWPFSPQSLFG